MFAAFEAPRSLCFSRYGRGTCLGRRAEDAAHRDFSVSTVRRGRIPAGRLCMDAAYAVRGHFAHPLAPDERPAPGNAVAGRLPDRLVQAPRTRRVRPRPRRARPRRPPRRRRRQLHPLFAKTTEEADAVVAPARVVLLDAARGEVCVPGLVDTHVHAPQLQFAGTATDRPLMQWLQKWTFPAEARFGDPLFAAAQCRALVRRLLAHGTTTACYSSSIHVGATIGLVDACLAHGQRAVVGKVCMDRHGMDGYGKHGAGAGGRRGLRAPPRRAPEFSQKKETGVRGSCTRP